MLQCTALHHAVMQESNLKVVQCLIEYGADVNSKDAAEVSWDCFKCYTVGMHRGHQVVE